MRPRAIGFLTLASAALGLAGAATADDDLRDAPALPATRLEMKQVLEGSKRSKPRLPLPEPTDEEREKARRGEWGVVNNARMRRLYLPEAFQGIGFTREPDANMTLTYPFKTSLFWIVSRINNCYYCMGHQEHKLADAGLPEERVAALDGDWSSFAPAERAAFEFTRKLSREPHAITAADVEALRSHYGDAQLLEILLAVGGFNAMNRWTGGLAIPQEEHREFLTPTSEADRSATSRVAPVDPARPSGAMGCALPARRPKPEPRVEVDAALAAARSRTPRLALASESDARAVAGTSADPLPEWVRLLARFPRAGGARIALHRACETAGELDPTTRAQIAWIAARHDRAWYALGHAERRLRELGEPAERVDALAGPWDAFPPAQRAAFALAKKLTVDPALVTDRDVEAARAHFSDKQVAEIVFQAAEAAFFDRVTEAAGLRLEF